MTLRFAAATTFALLALGCAKPTITPTAPPVETVPTLSALSAPDSLCVEGGLVTVTVDARADLDHVTLTGSRDGVLGMRVAANDAGLHGDALAGDGVWSYRLGARDWPDSWTTGGAFQLAAIAYTHRGLASSASNATLAFTARRCTPLATLSAPEVLDTLYDDRTLPIPLAVHVDFGAATFDGGGLEFVRATATRPDSGNVSVDLALSTTSVDSHGVAYGLYTGSFPASSFHVAGRYTVTFDARTGEDATPLSRDAHVYWAGFRGADPPTIVAVSMPETLAITADTTCAYYATVQVRHALGDSAIDSVRLKSYKPDGSQTNGGAAFALYNDGDMLGHGDSLARDSLWSEIFHCPGVGAQTGTYIFAYWAYDKVGRAAVDSVRVVVTPARASCSEPVRRVSSSRVRVARRR